MKKIVLIGFGGHGESIADSIRKRGEYDIVGYTDKKPSESETLYPYLGNDDVLQHLLDSGIEHAAICVGYLGDSEIRNILYDTAKRIGFCLPPIIDPTAILADNISVGEGSYIGKGTIVNAKSKIGKMCIINSGAVIEHENQVGDFTHIAVNAVMCGNVRVEDHVFIGANATVIQGLRIHAYSKIGAGSIILKNVSQKRTVYGIWNQQMMNKI